jgi:hypothetical protein
VKPGPPQDLDDETIRRIARSFYVVRMVRYALLLVALVVFLVASLVTDAPTAVAVALIATIVALVGVVGATHRRYVSSQRPPSGRPSSPSPTG